MPYKGRAATPVRSEKHGPGTDHRNPKLEGVGRLPDAEGDPDRDESADRLNHERTRAFRASRARRDLLPLQGSEVAPRRLGLDHEFLSEIEALRYSNHIDSRISRRQAAPKFLMASSRASASSSV
jgi:hypothetical protein